MPRRVRFPLPWQRSDRGNDWYITLKIGRKYVQQWLAPADTDPVTVQELAAKALTDARVRFEGQHLPFRMLMADFIRDSERDLSPKTVRNRRGYLNSFLNYLEGSTGVQFLAKDLKPYHVAGWIDAHPNWGANNRRTAMEILLTCLSWGRKQGWLEVNPLEGRLKLPAGVRRAREAYLDGQLPQLFLDACQEDYERHVVIGLHQSGVRPGEFCSITVERFDPIRGIWLVKGKKGERPVALSPQLLELSKELAQKHVSGPLFRTQTGRAWRTEYVDRLLSALRDRIRKKGHQISDHATPYAFRHTVATNLLLDGMNDSLVAKQLGHTTPVLHRTYNHLEVVEHVLPEIKKYTKPLGAAEESNKGTVSPPK
jgi:integrase